MSEVVIPIHPWEVMLDSNPQHPRSQANIRLLKLQDTYIDMDYDYGHETADNNMLTEQNNAADTQNCPTALHEVGFKAEPYGVVPGNDSQDLCLSELEYRIASYATENELSKSSYTGLISLIDSVIEHCPGASTQPYISIQSIESLNYKISLGNKSRYSIPFKTVEIDPADIDGFPERYRGI
ncbi:hypothetical protein BJV82DRAFT_24616 [Fennellomyces sp. T-0311]|nr:hypothetical protein BJV82DRAFT_24616 [Fennellomyces sp. T-0311]